MVLPVRIELTTSPLSCLLLTAQRGDEVGGMEWTEN